ncbi:hypothetical protein MLD38_036517 [Melastoma candidum]|uniref:Uncharacterized protein n=1 Tax=Melastoma candidum TaxID=119954 RepID=A0ACB9LL49_9MYRT|nr:hypothetical protein MLD38_036517 [Melastoma candidum]
MIFRHNGKGGFNFEKGRHSHNKLHPLGSIQFEFRKDEFQSGLRKKKEMGMDDVFNQRTTTLSIHPVSIIGFDSPPGVTSSAICPQVDRG